MSPPPQRILITGAGGWLGSRLVEALTHGLPDYPGFGNTKVRLRCLVLPGENTAGLNGLSDRIEIMEGDVRSPQDCFRFCASNSSGILFHTAGIIHPRRVSDFYSINAGGTKTLLEAAANAGLRRAVVVSSNSPCGCNPHPDHLFDELSPYRPYLHYGRSKMLMELATRAVHARGRLETVIIRCPWFYGPNQPARQTLFFRMIRQGKAPIVGSGRNLRSMSYVDNLCHGLLLAANSERANGQTYWLADEQPYSMLEIFDTVEQVMQKDFNLKCTGKRLRLPGFAASLAYCVDYLLQSAGGYHQKIHVLSEMNKSIACSVARAAEELGYRPAVALREGMRRSVAWCLERQIAL